MQHLKLPLFSLLSLGGAFVLSGCSGSFSFPNAELNPQVQTTSAGTITGSNFGGHAPIVGAKVFMLQASTSGYGTPATSLITAGNGTADTTIVGGTTTNPTAYYVTTNAAGFFNIPSTGYSCTPGLPVYLYAYAGAPDTNPSAGPTYITSATGNGTTTTFTVGNEKFYVGQQVTFEGIPTGNPFVGLDGGVVGGNGTDTPGTPQTVTAISTTDNTSFSIAYPFSGTTAAGAFGTNSTVTPIGVNNPGIVNIAVLGLCPNNVEISAIPAGTGLTTFTGVSASDLAKISVGELVQGPGLPVGGLTIATKTASGFTVNGSETGGNNSTAYNYAVGGGNFETTGGSPINFVYMNEVATAAAAFALAPFASQSTLTLATTVNPTYLVIGNTEVVSPQDAQHIGIPQASAATYTVGNGNNVTLTAATGDALALTAIQNAAVNAGQLYDITGATNTVSSTDGESHVARTVVPNNGVAGSQAYVPNALINTLGNILAACVDSNNTYGLGATTGTASAACATLFENATASGTAASSLTSTGVPTDIATAAINIAHHPGANVANLYTLAGNVAPFVPNLVSTGAGKPNDFVIGINIYQNLANVFLGNGSIPYGIATDASGNAIITTNGCTYGCVAEISPTQTLPVSAFSYAAGAYAVAISADSTPKVWVSNGTNATVGSFAGGVGTYYEGTEPLSSYTFTGYYRTTTAGTYFASPTSVALDGAGNAYFADNGDTNIYKVTTPGTAATALNPQFNGNSCNSYGMNAIAVDNAIDGYDIWAANSGARSLFGECESNNAGTVVESQQGGYGIGINTGVAVDNNGAAWFTASGGVVLQFPSLGGYNTQVFTEAGGAGINGPQAIAIDGNDELWIANKTGNSVSNFLNNGVAAPASGLNTATTTTPASSLGYTASGTIATPVGIALDPSGDVWVINQGNVSSATGFSPALSSNGNSGNGSVTELIGVAAPSYLPLAAASLNNKQGLKP